MITCKQIADMVGLSRQATASVLNDSPVCLVSPEKKAKILSLARKLHYVRSNAARTLARGKSGIIGILTGGLHIRKNQLNLILLDQVLREAGYLPCIVYTRSEEPNLVGGIRELLQQHADGLIINSIPPNVIESLRDSGFDRLIPTVFADSPGAEALGVHEVVYDYEPFCRRILEFCRERKIRNAAAFTCNDTGFYYLHYLIGQLMPRLGIPFDEFPLIERTRILDPERDKCRLFDKVHEKIMTMKKYDLLIFEQGSAAQSALWPLHERGWRIPDEVAVAAFSDFDNCGSFLPALTIPEFRPEEMAERIWQLLARVMKEPGLPPQRETIPLEMLEQESLRSLKPQAASHKTEVSSHKMGNTSCKKQRTIQHRNNKTKPIASGKGGECRAT